MMIGSELWIWDISQCSLRDRERSAKVCVSAVLLLQNLRHLCAARGCAYDDDDISVIHMMI